MHFSPAVALLAALAPSCILAAPTKTTHQRRWNYGGSDASDYVISSIAPIWQDAGNCDLSQVSMPLDSAPNPTPLPGPSSGLVLSHVAVGRGTQNYTCADNSPSTTPVAKGAVATLFNATCQAARSPDLLYDTPAIALRYSIPDAQSALAAFDILMSGHHYFTDDKTPFFNLDTDQHAYGTVACKKAAEAKAPTPTSSAFKSLLAGSGGSSAVTGAQDGSVTWLKLSSKNETGYTWREVYRLNTAGGAAPTDCSQQGAGDFQVDYSATYWFWTEPGKDGYLNGAVAGTPDGQDSS